MIIAHVYHAAEVPEEEKGRWNKLKIKYILDDGAFMPRKAHKWDAGFDLRVPDKLTGSRLLRHGSKLFIDTGVHIGIPEGYVGMVKSRSGMYRNKGIRTEGVVDAGYVGSIGVTLFNDSGSDYIIDPGDRIAQLVIMPIPEVELEAAEVLGDSERGDNGFGSTGV